MVLSQDAFTVGGERLRFPGDPQGSPGNTINCRCTVLPVVGEAALPEEAPVATVPRFADIGEAEQWASGVLADRVSFAGIEDARVSQRIVDTLHDLQQQTGLRFREIETFNGGNSEDAIFADAGGVLNRLRLNADVWATPQSFRAQMRKIPNGYFAERSSTGILTHESGHQLAFLHRQDVPALQELWAAWNGQGLGSYARWDYREMTAEAFARFMTEGGRQSLLDAGLGRAVEIFEGWMR